MLPSASVPWRMAYAATVSPVSRTRLPVKLSPVTTDPVDRDVSDYPHAVVGSLPAAPQGQVENGQGEVWACLKYFKRAGVLRDAWERTSELTACVKTSLKASRKT